MGTLTLAKVSDGQRLNLSKLAHDNNISLDKVVVGLGWDENDSGSGHEFDADVSLAFLSNGKCINEHRFLFYNTNGGKDLSLYNDSKVAYAQHSGDNRTGDGDGDDESVAVNLSDVPSDVTEIAIYVTIHDAVSRRQNFGMLNNSYVRIVDFNSNQEIIKWELDFDASTADAVKFGSLMKRNGEWYFSANKIFEDGGLAGIVNRVGLNT